MGASGARRAGNLGRGIHLPWLYAWGRSGVSPVRNRCACRRDVRGYRPRINDVVQIQRAGHDALNLNPELLIVLHKLPILLADHLELLLR